MKRRELYDIAKELQVVRQPGKTFTLVIADNKKRLSEAIFEMEKEIDQSEEYKNHLKEAESLKRKYAVKDHIGRPVMKPGNYPNGERGMFYEIKGSEDPKSEFRIALSELETKNAECILAHEEKEKKYWEDFLDEDLENEFEFRKIKYSEVPKDITQPEMDAILDLIDDLPENIGKHGKK